MHIHLPDERIPEILQAMLNDPNCGTIYRIKGANRTVGSAST